MRILTTPPQPNERVLMTQNIGDPSYAHAKQSDQLLQRGVSIKVRFFSPCFYTLCKFVTEIEIVRTGSTFKDSANVLLFCCASSTSFFPSHSMNISRCKVLSLSLSLSLSLHSFSRVCHRPCVNKNLQLKQSY